MLSVAALVAGNALTCATAGAQPVAVDDAVRDARRTVVATLPTRLIVPVLELRVERVQGPRWSWALMGAYGGEQGSTSFAEIGVLGGGARLSYFALGDRRLGIGAAVEARVEQHVGIAPQLGQEFDIFFGDPFGSGAAAQELSAEQWVAAGGAFAFARASRRRLFVELSVGIGWQHRWRTLVLDGREANHSDGQLWLPWAVALGVWI